MLVGWEKNMCAVWVVPIYCLGVRGEIPHWILDGDLGLGLSARHDL